MIIGLTGGIGSGKSTVAQTFRELGITVIDADEITHQLLASNSSVIAAIAQHFDSALLPNGSLNLVQLRSLVFRSPAKRRWLEMLLHPLIQAEILARASASNSAYTIVEIPLLIETNFQDKVDRILVVDCSEDTQIKRVSKRDAVSKNAVQAIIRNQANREQRLANAEDVIENNNDDREILKQKVLTLHQSFMRLRGMGVRTNQI